MGAEVDSSATLVCADADNVLGCWHDTLIQLRRGALSRRILDFILPRGRILRAQNPEGIGLLTVLERSADIPTPEVRAVQANKLREFYGQGPTFSAIAVEGDALLRQLRNSAITSTRTTAQIPTVAVEASVAAAARLIARSRERADAAGYARGLVDAVESLRQRYHVRGAP